MANALSYWERHLDRKAPDTVKGYRKHFNRFIERTGLTAEELYEMQKRAEKAEDPRDTGEAVDLVVDHIKWMMAEGYSAGTIGLFVTAINVFFNVNKCEGFDIPKEDIPFADHDGQHVITKAQLRKVWDRTGEEFKLRNRAMVMMGKDIGLRIGDMAEITVREYLEAEDLKGQSFPVEENGREIMVKGDGFKRWVKPIVTKKRRRNAHTHLGPESVEAIDAYIDERQRRSGKRYSVVHGGNTEMRLYPVFDVEQKLFLGRAGRPLSTDALGQQFERLCGDYAKISSHSFRKYHRTMLEGAGMPEAWVKKLQGKAASVYSQPEKTGQLTGKYIHCYHALMVFYKDNEEVNALKDTVTELTSKLEEVSQNGVKQQIAEQQMKIAEQQIMMDEMQKSIEIINKRVIERRIFEKRGKSLPSPPRGY